MNISARKLMLLAGLCLAFTSQAQQPEQPQQPSPSTNVVFAGVKVGIDPATGRLRNLTPEESAALSKVLTQKRTPVDSARYGRAPADNAAAARTVRKSANGTVSARVPQSAMPLVTARIGADGKVVISESGHTNAAPAAREVKE
jgi:hypothetical protein